MSHRSLIVLKFGGSVLRDQETLRLAVHEIHRWRREAFRVVAVVSALAGVTDELLRTTRRISEHSSDHVVASIASAGELQCAALLGQLLERAGIPSRVLTPAAIGLVATGPALDADPSALNTSPIQHALEDDEVVVVPGFVGLDDRARTVVFGRGGSDLTALFLASRLRATRCRLVKDVGGIYERDPAAPGTPPERYSQLSWNDALRIDGSVVQRKAIRFARSQGLSYEVGGFNGERPTIVGPAVTRLEPAPIRPAPLRVGLLGLGTVGGGLYQLLKALPETFEVTGVAVREPGRARDVAIDPNLLTANAARVIRGADVVVETIGGTVPAHELIRASLDVGAHVVTANKAAVAVDAAGLARLAADKGVQCLHSAAVGGCTPLLERLGRAPVGVESVRGVLNGTVNFLLDGLALGHGLPELLADAVQRGFAEQDASRDLSGQDAADKLVVTAALLGWELDAAAITCEALDGTTVERARRAAAQGLTLRQVSSVSIEDGEVVGRVALEELEPSDELCATYGGANVAVIGRAGGSSEVVRGEGAGRWPTAESVLGDLLELARAAEHAAAPQVPVARSEEEELYYAS